MIIISSQHGMIGPPGHLAYAVSKGGLVNMTHQLAVDYARRGVYVNAVAPGKILTGSPEQQSPDALVYSHARTPFPRLGRPEDVAGAALFLASDDSGYVSGVNLLVDIADGGELDAVQTPQDRCVLCRDPPGADDRRSHEADLIRSA